MIVVAFTLTCLAASASLNASPIRKKSLGTPGSTRLAKVQRGQIRKYEVVSDLYRCLICMVAAVGTTALGADVVASDGPRAEVPACPVEMPA